jgi:tRNA(Ile)-lysidine synthase
VSFGSERLKLCMESCLAPVAGKVSGWCVALSGGLDSTVLLTALAQIRGLAPNSALRAVHVDHGLHPDSGDWSHACGRLAAELGVGWTQLSVHARGQAGDSPEAAARAARYAAIAEELSPGEVLLTAHHADDQMETMLLQWLRGGGLRAIAGMARLQPFGPGWQARPLLDFTRADLLEFARSKELAWQEDPSNLDPRFDRNYLRMNVLPAMRERWPGAARTMARVGDFAREALDLEEQVAAADLADSAEGSTLVLDRITGLTEVRQRAVIRAWLRALGLNVPPSATLAALRHDIRRSGADRVPCTRWSGVAVHRYRGRLYAEPWPANARAVRPGRWQPGGPYQLDSRSELELRAVVGRGLSRARMPDLLQVRAWAGGDRLRLPGGRHRKQLRKLAQERGVLPWHRCSVPVVSAGDQIVAVGGIAISADWAAEPGEAGWELHWRNRPLLTEREFLDRPLISMTGGDA